jgi:hypothetical protein
VFRPVTLTEKRLQFSGHLFRSLLSKFTFAVPSIAELQGTDCASVSEVKPFIKRYFLFLALKGDAFNRLIDDVDSLTSATSFVLCRN